MADETGALPPPPERAYLPTDDMQELTRQLNQAASAREAHSREELLTDVTLQLEVATIGVPDIDPRAAFKALEEFWQRARAIDVRFGSPHPLPDQPRPEEGRGAVDERNALQRLQRWVREVCAADVGVASRVRERMTATREGAGETGAVPGPPAIEPTPARLWNDWVEELQLVRVVDPSCGSGAFLIEAFDQLFAQYREANARLTELRGGQPTLFDADETILTRNLFGMDLNGEAVQIARLSCWIKTAARGKKLTALDANIVQGNSVVADGPPLDAWEARFPEVFATGGFDAVIGNPPYVRHELITESKPYLQQHYRAFDGVADLYVYFYELGLNVLKPGGRLGYIVTNK